MDIPAGWQTGSWDVFMVAGRDILTSWDMGQLATCWTHCACWQHIWWKIASWKAPFSHLLDKKSAGNHNRFSPPN